MPEASGTRAASDGAPPIPNLILTQDDASAAEWRALLEPAGLVSCHWPAFQIEALSDADILAAFDSGAEGVVLPSPAAVRVVAQALQRGGRRWPSGVWGQAVRMPSRGISVPVLGCWCRLRRIRTRPIWRVSCSAFSRYRSASWCSTARMGAASGPACCRMLASRWTGSPPTRPGGARRRRPVSWKPGRAGRRLRPTRRYRNLWPCRIRTRLTKTQPCRVVHTG